MQRSPTVPVRGRAFVLSTLTSALLASSAGAQTVLFEAFDGAANAPGVSSGMLRVELLRDPTPQTFELELPSGARLTLARTSLEPSWRDGVVWSGVVVNDPLGSAVFSVLDDVAVGSLRAGGQLYAVEFDGQGLHRIRSVDENAMPPCGTDASLAVGAPPSAGAPSAPPFSAPAGVAASSAPTPAPTIDVLVLYTSDAKLVEGGEAAIQAKVNLAIAETNQAYANSQVTQRLRLVHQAEALGFDEVTSFSSMLSQLRIDGDGFVDEAHTLRNQYGADMVALIVAGSQYCGIGYLMTQPSASFEDRAFSVTSRVCATGYYTFGHELGHNMGCAHDRANASVGVYPYSFGYRTASGAYRTVMAYAPGQRVQYFSNPNVSFNGEALGIAEPAPDSAENWKSLNNTGPILAQFRCAIPLAYGTSKVTSAGSSPQLATLGSVSIAAGNLSLRLSQALPDKSSIAFYGFAPNNAPWNGGNLYVAAPLKRLAVRQLDAAGAANFPFSLALCQPGDVLYCQGWFRDPAAPDGSTVGLSHGLRVDVCP
jgi:hypothetical protein